MLDKNRARRPGGLSLPERVSRNPGRSAFAADYSAGGSDGSYGGLLALGYHYGSEDRYGLRFGYRYLEIELGDEDRTAKVETTLALSGPLLGFTFSW